MRNTQPCCTSPPNTGWKNCRGICWRARAANRRANCGTRRSWRPRTWPRRPTTRSSPRHCGRTCRWPSWPACTAYSKAYRMDTTSSRQATTRTPTTCCRDRSTIATWCHRRPGRYRPNNRRPASTRSRITVTRTLARRSRPTRPCSITRYHRHRSPFSPTTTRCPPTVGHTVRRAAHGLPPIQRYLPRPSTQPRLR